jgi:hypothetical protein
MFLRSRLQDKKEIAPQPLYGLGIQLEAASPTSHRTQARSPIYFQDEIDSRNNFADNSLPAAPSISS